jgi:hypothetical protein
MNRQFSVFRILREQIRIDPVRSSDWQSSIAVDRVGAAVDPPSATVAPTHRQSMVFPLTSDDVLSRRTALAPGFLCASF